MDEFVIYPRALTAEEVGRVMASPIEYGDNQGDACDACPASMDGNCAPVTCRDDDGDGYGVLGASACGGVGAGRERKFDCADGDVNRHPGALEKCDSIDNDCDGRVDEACMQNVVTTRYVYNAFNQLVSSGRDLEGVCSANDTDCDGVADAADNCPQVYNADQVNSDGNAVTPVQLGAIAHYDFDTMLGADFADLAGSFPATMGAQTQRVAGRPGGGQGVATDGTLGSVVTIPRRSTRR
jgi:Putative metal-binding motif